MPFKDPEDRRRYDRERKHAIRAASASTPVVVPAEVRIKVAGDVGLLLKEAVRLTLSDPKARPIEKARTLGYLSSIGLRLLQVHELEDRLEALERVMRFSADSG
jgi:hypothetical protein